MTNILALPELAGSLSATNNADWRFSIQFVAAGTTTPIDLTGISFLSQTRSAASSAVVVLNLSTATGTLVTDPTNGRLSWAVPLSMMSALSGDYVTDLVAVADGITRNLCPAPLTLSIVTGVTR